MPAQNISSPDAIRRRLKVKSLKLRQDIAEKHKRAEKFFKTKNFDPGRIREHSAKLLTAGAVTGALLLSSSGDIKALPTPDALIEKLREKGSGESHKFMVSTFKSVLPQRARPLSRNEEKLLEQMFMNVVGVPARATLEGEHLNQTFGYIGAEQHLRRFPGDTLEMHISPSDSAERKTAIRKEGIAPGLGAWGYFANSKESMAPDLIEKEKWYAVVQTLYLPDWNTRTKYLRQWYKHRKVLIVNTDNGNAVVAAIADSGPAAWTGKHFGGSPEVMDYLGGARYKKGPVVLFFVDDPENKIPLGPVEY